MQTFTQICHELGYKSYKAGYDKLKRAGIDLPSLPRFVGEDGRTLFYDDDTKEYLKSVIKPCEVKHQVAALKRIEAKKALVKMEQRSARKVQVSEVKPEPKTEKKTIVSAAKSSPVVEPDYERRLQQIKVLGEMLTQQIEMISRDMTSVRVHAAS